MIDIVIPYGNGAKNHELIYCLRSIDKYLYNYRNIFIIGEFVSLPDITNIQVRDLLQQMWKEKNIYTKLLTACNDKRVSENFLWVSDDHFFLKKTDAAKITQYQKGNLKAIYDKRNKEEIYSRTMKNTLDLCGQVKCFDVHAPMMFNKEMFKKLSKIEWRKPFGYCIKTVYCVLNNLDGEFLSDCKIDKKICKKEIYEIIKDKNLFSCGDKAFHGDLSFVLNELYPKKSKYEL